MEAARTIWDIQAMTCGIYRIVNQHNNKFYIGSSTNIETRWKNHKASLRHNHHANLHLQSAWNKYGESSFVFEILKIVPKHKLQQAEQLLLDESITSKQCYNINKHADAPMRGRTHSLTTKRHLSKVRRGVQKSQEWKDKIRATNIITWKQKFLDPAVKKQHLKISKYWSGGEDSPCVKITADLVRQIRLEYSQGNVTQKSLAVKYNLKSEHIHSIVRFRIWRSV